jgi:DNA-binding IclR family transcriptional regulator
MDPGPPPAKEHRTVARVTAILEAVAAQPDGVPLSALALTLRAPRSSVHALAKGLVAAGYLRERDGLYVLGPAITALLDPARPTLDALARPVLEALSAESGETAMLGTLVGRSVVYVAAVDSAERVRYSAPLRQRRPVWPTSVGKCFLASMAPARRAVYVDDPDAIAAELDRVRTDGFAVNRGETLPDIAAVASPVLRDGRVIAALAVAGPATRMTAKLEAVAPVVRDAAAELSERA